METAKDYGFNEGYIVNRGETVPDDHLVVSQVDIGSVAIPKETLQKEQEEFKNSVKKFGDVGSFLGPKQAGLRGEAGLNVFGKNTNESDDLLSFGHAYRAAKGVLNSTGITKVPTQTDILVGHDFNGQKVYSNPELANNSDVTKGAALVQSSGMALGAMGAFTNKEDINSYMQIGLAAQDQGFHQELDNFKDSQDPNGFVAALKKVNKDSNSGIDFTAYKLYENWNNMSASQKAIAIAGAGIQGYKFSNGDTFYSKRLTPEIKGAPSLNAGEGLSFASQGVNVSPATKQWGQLTAIQDTVFKPKTAKDVVNTANSMGLLGHGENGQLVPITEKAMIDANMTSVPQYGVGAATIPYGQGIPTGYVLAARLKDAQVVIPAGNKDTAHMVSPEISTEAASNIHAKWGKPDIKAGTPNGIIGGSALIGGLSAMTGVNPYTLGAVVTHATYENVEPNRATPMSEASQGMGITLHRLKNGEVSKGIDEKANEFVVEGNGDEFSFEKTAKIMRGNFAKAGISSKEIGYQLANQGFSEGRFNESQYMSLIKHLDMVFEDNGYQLYSKLSTGKEKGFKILEERRG